MQQTNWIEIFPVRKSMAYIYYRISKKFNHYQGHWKTLHTSRFKLLVKLSFFFTYWQKWTWVNQSSERNLVSISKNIADESLLFQFPNISIFDIECWLQMHFILYLQSVKLVIPASVVMGTLGTSPFMITIGLIATSERYINWTLTGGHINYLDKV